MHDQEALDRLAVLCGIAPEYTDVWGQSHSVSAATKQALLAAMGVAVADAAQLRASLADRETGPWLRPLPPVWVHRIGPEPLRIPITLPVEPDAMRLRWLIQAEGSSEHQGELSVEALQVTDERELGNRHYRRYVFVPDLKLPYGYHRLRLMHTGGAHWDEMPLIIAPGVCYQPPAFADGGRLWGPTVQLYSVRSHRNGGIGDFTDLRHLIELCHAAGADLVGVNPLHSLFPHNPAHASPYSPSSRLFHNVLYLDVGAIPELDECAAARELIAAPEYQAQLAALQDASLVDYPAVWAAKLEVLERLYADFRHRHLALGSERGQAFWAFQAAGGEALEWLGRYEALQAHFQQQDSAIWGWPVWPPAYRDPDAPAVAEFAQSQREQVEFFHYLQWHADAQLAAAGQRAYALGLGVGLYQDLAVSVDRAGADVWSEQTLYAAEVSIGAPPDEFNLKGQNWGLPPMVPERLRERAYAPFIALLRQNMRHAGALRIDHVMALMRLFWIPPGATPAEGAYVHYPVGDLLGILALESQRNHCLVIGEDLGTLPETLRETLGPLGVLSYRIVYFERDAHGEFIPPDQYPEQALVAITTHDLPTLAGFWLGHDLALRQRFNLFPTDQQREEQIVGRAQDRARLLLALQRENLLPEGLNEDSMPIPEMTDALMRAVHCFIAQTPARIMAFQPEDVFGCVEQINLPGTTDEHPNWCRRLSVPLEVWSKDARFIELCEMLRRERPAAPRPAPIGSGLAPAVPIATYRLQFNREFTFTQAARLVAYLHELGISHCYASPYLKARSGSTHGYDIIDHTALNPEIGNEEEFEHFIAALHGHGMGQILDIVPNHMGVMGGDNLWWLDVLENGQASPYAEYFDIDWRPVREELRGKVLLPVLGAPYGAELERGELHLQLLAEQGELTLYYYEHRFPIDPTTYPEVLGLHLERLEPRLGDDEASITELQSIITAFSHLPPREATDDTARAERLREKEVCKRRLAQLCERAPAVAEFLAGNVAFFCGRSGEPESFEPLHRLLERQAYRLAHWRVAADEINYRRFFDINDLAALRMENPQVFEATHGRIFEWIANGQVDGLRVDHPDGLYDPLAYCRALMERLQAKAVPALGNGTTQQAAQPYLVVEKILASYEHLPEDWPVAGTTGYDFAQVVNGLFVYAPAEPAFERIYQRFIGKRIEFDELLYGCKRLIIRVHLSSELTVLANRLNRIAQANWRTRDYTLNGLRDALTEVVACFPVYRTYISEDSVSNEDRRYIDWAVAQAKQRSRATSAGIFDFIRALLLLEGLDAWSTALRQQALQFTLKLQQYTAPIMAKALEDTSFYIYNRLVSLNDVGGDPRRFGVSVAAFHHFNQEHARRWPHALLATSTHDNKRSEDVRARINVLTELPDAWRARLARWRRMNRAKLGMIDENPAPSRNDQYLIYQTLVGTWPLDLSTDAELAAYCERIEAYLLKAIREAKAQSSWLNPNPAYEEAALAFVRAVLSSPLQNNPFLGDFRAFIKPISRYGLLNSLAQTLLKLTSPGVPDIYQGNELWDFSLVDPDNRRPVDYHHRERLLSEVRTIAIGQAATPTRLAALLENLEDGRLKLYLTRQVLMLRHRHQALFQHGDYRALTAQGTRAEHICAFARRHETEVGVIATGRWFARLAAGRDALTSSGSTWADTWVESPAAGDYLNALTGERIVASEAESGACFAAAELFRCLPVALLLRQEI